MNLANHSIAPHPATGNAAVRWCRDVEVWKIPVHCGREFLMTAARIFNRLSPRPTGVIPSWSARRAFCAIIKDLPSWSLTPSFPFFMGKPSKINGTTS